jgi:hypothetical protein
MKGVKLKFGEMLATYEPSLLLTGQLFFREASDQTAQRMTGPYRNLFSTSGVIAMPVNYPFKGEHQYTIAGIEVKSQGGIIIALDPTTGKDISEISIGNSHGGLLREGIWRV